MMFWCRLPDNIQITISITISTVLTEAKECHNAHDISFGNPGQETWVFALAKQFMTFLGSFKLGSLSHFFACHVAGSGLWNRAGK